MTSSTSAELFDERFIDHLFGLVERTRLLDDETLNYALIKLIVSTFSISLVGLRQTSLTMSPCSQSRSRSTSSSWSRLSPLHKPLLPRLPHLITHTAHLICRILTNTAILAP